MVTDLIGRAAVNWTMIVLEVLADPGETRFTALGRQVPGISQKMLTQTLRAMERDGLLIRTIHRVIPPGVDDRLTDHGRGLGLGLGLGDAFCGVRHWAATNLSRIDIARQHFDAGQGKTAGGTLNAR